MTRRRIKESKSSNSWIGSRLARLRRLRHMTQQEVGDILQRTDSAVSDIENGYSDLTVDHLLKMSEGFGVPVAGLLLPDPGATASIPYAGSPAMLSGQVVELLSHEQKRFHLGRILEALPRLTLDQLSHIAQSLEQLTSDKSLEKSSAA